MIYFARKQDCHACALKPQCCPNVPARKIARSVHEAARDKARAIAKTGAYAVSCRERKKVEMLFAHLKRILKLGRLRLRGPSGARCSSITGAAKYFRKGARSAERASRSARFQICAPLCASSAKTSLSFVLRSVRPRSIPADAKAAAAHRPCPDK